MAEGGGGLRLYALLGNTSLRLGLWADGWVLRSCENVAGTCGFCKHLASLREASAVRPVTGGLICTSSPRGREFEEALVTSLGVPIDVVGLEVQVPLEVAYELPRTFGADRLLDCYAALRVVGGPCVVLDAGTCLTCDAVTRDGTVLPIGISAGLPAMRAGIVAMAPHLAPPLEQAAANWQTPATPAQGTEQSLSMGLLASLAGAAEALLKAAYDALGDPQAACVVTGGDGAALGAALSCEVLVLHDLAMDGLRLLDEERLRNDA